MVDFFHEVVFCINLATLLSDIMLHDYVRLAEAVRQAKLPRKYPFGTGFFPEGHQIPNAMESTRG